MTPTTTLAAIRAHHPCEDGWRKLLAHLGKTAVDDEPLTVLTVLDGNGLDDALWVLDRTPETWMLRRCLRADYAERVLLIFEAACPGDDAPRRAIALARDPKATPEALRAAREAAEAVAWAAMRAQEDGE